MINELLIDTDAMIAEHYAMIRRELHRSDVMVSDSATFLETQTKNYTIDHEIPYQL